MTPSPEPGKPLSETEHTPTPWEFAHNDGFPGYRILESGRMLYDHLATLQGTQAKADAEFIVKAVNAYEDLQAKIEHQAAQIQELQNKLAAKCEYHTAWESPVEQTLRAYGKALEVIAWGNSEGNPERRIAQEVLKQFPLSGSEEGGEGR